MTKGIIIVLIAYIIAVGYNVVTISNIAEEKLQENSIAIGIEVASRLGLVQTLQLLINSDSLYQNEKAIRALASVMMDWYAPIKFVPVLSVSKELYILLIQSGAAASASSTKSASASNDFAYVSTDALNVRSGPSANHAKVGELSRNTKVEILSRSGTWWKIRAGNIEGYVNSEYLGNQQSVINPNSGEGIRQEQSLVSERTQIRSGMAPAHPDA